VRWRAGSLSFLSSRAERGILPAVPETRRQDPSLRSGMTRGLYRC
jgi:hypothetical protein